MYIRLGTYCVCVILPAFFGVLLNAVFVNDVSRLNRTAVARIEKPRTVYELSEIVNRAKQQGLKVAISGVRHSQGGHAFYPNAVVIDTQKLNKILSFNKMDKTITVEPGVTWKQIQQLINPHGLALQVMQTANIFTVGGSLSVNCHGRDPSYGPLIESIISFKMLLADGSLVRVSREEQSELFSLAIGGYGLFGIVTEITIALADNCLYKTDLKMVPIEQYAGFLQKEIIGNPRIGLHYGELSLSPLSYLGHVFSFTHTTIDKALQKTDLIPERLIALTKFRLKLRRASKFFNYLGGTVDWLGVRLRKIMLGNCSRNNAMQHPVECLENHSPHDTDVLQSYFIPLQQFTVFLHKLCALIMNENMHVLQVLTRFIPKNTENLLCYTRDDAIEVVIFLNSKRTLQAVAKLEASTRKLIDVVLSLGGNYYLPVRLYATNNQLRRAYPMIDEFFKKKRFYDPEELFMNSFYAKYAY